MITLIAILTFAGAMGAAAFVIAVTVAPAWPKIVAALAGNGGVQSTPPVHPVSRVSTLRVAVKPSAQPVYWRAAA